MHEVRKNIKDKKKCNCHSTSQSNIILTMSKMIIDIQINVQYLLIIRINNYIYIIICIRTITNI